MKFTATKADVAALAVTTKTDLRDLEQRLTIRLSARWWSSPGYCSAPCTIGRPAMVENGTGTAFWKNRPRNVEKLFRVKKLSSKINMEENGIRWFPRSSNPVGRIEIIR
jgi:hypothetical protein